MDIKKASYLQLVVPLGLVIIPTIAGKINAVVQEKRRLKEENIFVLKTKHFAK